MECEFYRYSCEAELLLTAIANCTLGLLYTVVYTIRTARADSVLFSRGKRALTPNTMHCHISVNRQLRMHNHAPVFRDYNLAFILIFWPFYSFGLYNISSTVSSFSIYNSAVLSSNSTYSICCGFAVQHFIEV